MANEVEQISDSDDSVEMFDDQNENLNPLVIERGLIREAMLRIQRYSIIAKPNKKKNAEDSIQYRKKGNKLYSSDSSHNSEIHTGILELYSKSIALAPTDSEELALAYGNRAALLFHLKKYEECIKDCDRVLDITVSDYLEAKLLCRKAECLAALSDKMAKYVCEEALELFKQLTLDKTLKSNFIEKLNNIKNSCLNDESKENKDKIEKREETLPAFARNKEAPCASEAVTIKYNKEWGRHVVATREIEPGEIIAVEKNYYRYHFSLGRYFHCSNCSQFTWSSIPCQLCIYDVYCSEACRSEAWKKFHQFECEIYPLIWDIENDSNPTYTICNLRFLLSATHEIGGIQQLKKEYLNLEKNKDHRSKGFSTDGVFYSDRCTSILSLTNCRDGLDNTAIASLSQNAAVTLFLLANNTKFFGKKLGISAIDLLKFEEAWFIGALLLKIYCLLPSNSITHSTCSSCFGIIINPFCSLLNHNCDPNVNLIHSKNNEIIVYARYPIKKEEQLFRSYCLDWSKDQRQAFLSKIYRFKCDCKSCKENWSNTCLPTLKDMIGTNGVKDLLLEVQPQHKLSEDLTKINIEIQYSPESLKSLKRFLSLMAAKASVHCEDYAYLEKSLFGAYNKAFGLWIDMPDTC